MKGQPPVVRYSMARPRIQQWHLADPKQRGFPNKHCWLFKHHRCKLPWSVILLGAANTGRYVWKQWAEVMHKTYTANPKYRLSILLCFLLLSIPTLFAVIEWARGEKTILIIISSLFVLFLACYMCWIAREITISDQYVQVKTLFTKRTIPAQEILSVTESYSKKSMIWHSNDKSKAHMLCFVRFGDNPFAIFLVHSGISDYKTACTQLAELTRPNAT